MNSFSKTLDEHLEHITVKCDKIGSPGLKLKLKKWFIAVSEIEVLGHIVSSDGMRTDPTKLEKVARARIPKSKKELQSFLIFCLFY